MVSGTFWSRSTQEMQIFSEKCFKNATPRLVSDVLQSNHVKSVLVQEAVLFCVVRGGGYTKYLKASTRIYGILSCVILKRQNNLSLTVCQNWLDVAAPVVAEYQRDGVHLAILISKIHLNR